MWDGGTILNMLSSSPIIKDCLFYDNQALGNDGGALFNVLGSHPVVQRCSFINNRAASWGGAMRNHDSSPVISNCLFANSWARDNGGAIFNYNGSSPQLTNCTFVGNSAYGNGGESLYSLSQCSPTAYNCIFWDGFGGTEIECNQAEILVFYSDIRGGYNGQTNIYADPLFVDPCNPDLGIRNYRLQVTSPCINTGDPNYIAEVNETDLDGQPRIIGVRIDMGAYEFSNQIPVADAGDDQIIYAYIDNIAEVNLDGSRSYSPEGKPLTYLWKWVIHGNSYEANGVNPTIDLPVGIHTVELIVNDGLDDSQPDSVNISVVAPLKGRLNIVPSTINRRSNQPHILAIIEIGDIAKSGINAYELLTLYPGEIKATKQWLFTSKDRHGKPQTTIFAFFDKDALMTAVPENGDKELIVAGKLKSGQYFYGSDIIKVIGKKNGL
jgi:hypothetical protein